MARIIKNFKDVEVGTVFTRDFVTAGIRKIAISSISKSKEQMENMGQWCIPILKR